MSQIIKEDAEYCLTVDDSDIWLMHEFDRQHDAGAAALTVGHGALDVDGKWSVVLASTIDLVAEPKFIGQFPTREMAIDALWTSRLGLHWSDYN